MFTKRGEGADEVDILMFETNQRQLKASRRQLEELIGEKPELGGLVEYETLRDYSTQLRKENLSGRPHAASFLKKLRWQLLAVNRYFFQGNPAPARPLSRTGLFNFNRQNK